MANTFPEVAAVSVETGTAQHYVDWGAIAAGVFVAIAISSVFLAFGSAIGLSLTSFNASESTPVIGLAIAAGLWLLWVQISSFVGGAITLVEQLRAPSPEAKKPAPPSAPAKKERSRAAPAAK